MYDFYFDSKLKINFESHVYLYLKGFHNTKQFVVSTLAPYKAVVLKANYIEFNVCIHNSITSQLLTIKQNHTYTDILISVTSIM